MSKKNKDFDIINNEFEEKAPEKQIEENNDKFEGVVLYEIIDECSFEHPKTKKQYKHIWVKFPNDEIKILMLAEIWSKEQDKFDVLTVFVDDKKIKTFGE